MPRSTWRDRLFVTTAPLAAIIGLGVALLVAIGFLVLFSGAFVFLLCLLLVAWAAIAGSIAIFGRLRVESFLRRFGLNLDLTPDEPRKDEDGIEDAIILEETPPPSRRR